MTTQNTTYQDHIVCIPGVMGGKPVIKGTRIPVDLILERLAYDLDLKTLFEDYPTLTKEDVKACLAFARELLEEEAEEREWDILFAQPHVQVGLDRLAQEAERQYAAGEIEEGGFAVE